MLRTHIPTHPSTHTQPHTSSKTLNILHQTRRHHERRAARVKGQRNAWAACAHLKSPLSERELHRTVIRPQRSGLLEALLDTESVCYLRQRACTDIAAQKALAHAPSLSVRYRYMCSLLHKQSCLVSPSPLRREIHREILEGSPPICGRARCQRCEQGRSRQSPARRERAALA
eukprot:6176191-Pleurochrysis_carterae.AAC.4